ncbi:MAG TPA: MaoC/PaaZ C-terminal domain-containing protein [Pseudomonadales bacterium]|nr:MaoC/PaaZ C-terminal domain-containing protein [Pseudomonadales bacterium]
MALLLSNVHEYIGQEVSVTDWVDIDQMQVNIFGEITRWAKRGHCDREWAEQHSPYGGTLVHGFFMVSLVTHFLELGGFLYKDGRNPLNYGMDKARILTPVVIGDGVRLRDRIGVMDVQDKEEGRRLIKTSHHIEAEGLDKPAAYVEYLNLWRPR